MLRGQFLGTALNCRTFTNFVFVESSYAPKEGLARHSHERAFLSIALRGPYTEDFGSCKWECAPGEAIFHVAGEVHSNRFHEHGARVLNLEILPHFLQQINEYGIETNNRARLRSPYSLQLGFRLYQETSIHDATSELAVEGLAMEFLAELLRPRDVEPRRRASDWLKQVNDILHDRYREPLTLGELATSANVHPVHLARAFRQRYRCCVGDYIRRLRLTAACLELSNSETPIAEIAARNGFSDQSHLSRVLKQYIGMSPGQFRHLHCGPSPQFLCPRANSVQR